MSYSHLIQTSREISDDICKSDTYCNVINAIAPTIAKAGAIAATGNSGVGEAASAGVRAVAAGAPRETAKYLTRGLTGVLLDAIAPILIVTAGVAYSGYKAVEWCAHRVD